MLFFSSPFVVFFAAFYPAFLLLRKHVVARNILLIVAAFVFYGWWDVRFTTLLAFTVGLDYLSALGAAGRLIRPSQLAKSCAFLGGIGLIALVMNHLRQLEVMTLPVMAALILYIALVFSLNAINDEKARRRCWLHACVIVNFAVLAFFKYMDFFAESLDHALALGGVHLGFVPLEIILPLGISFHTFQSIGRTIDVSRGRLEPSENFIEFATFLTYFPQILAGPIERASHMLPQFRSVQPISWAQIQGGIILFMWGLFKKRVIADNLAIIANPIFHAPHGLTSGQLLVGALAFSFQIYGDFSGYSDMARGLASLMGFDLRRNFALPYFSRTPSEFWRRWHISLSEWLRDYLYVALGGNRGGRWKTYRNLMLTMVLGGLWHGAAWTFIIWGSLHGLILVIYRAFRIDDSIEKNRSSGLWLRNSAAWALFIPLVVLTWIYFRAESVESGTLIVTGILAGHALASGPWGALTFYAAPLFAIEATMRLRESQQTGESPRPGGNPRLALIFARPPFLVRYTMVLLLVLANLVLVASTDQQFIYFDF